MVIDVHTHIAFDKIYPPAYLTGMLDGQVQGMDRGKLLSVISFFLRDKGCDQFVKQMDKAGIARAVLLIIDGGVGMEEARLSLEEIHLLHYQVLQKYPDRFLVFAGVDPRRGPYGLDLFRRSVHDYGFQGLKLYPPMGYAMDDEWLYPYYEICAEHQLNVLIHTGPSLATLHNHFADPIHVYQVAQDFPDVNFILAHAGYNFLHPSVQQVLPLPNVYLDIAGFQTLYKEVNQSMVAGLGPIFSEGLNEKVLFGSDWPLFNVFTPVATHVEMLRAVFDRLPAPKDPAALENVLYRNATKVLRLE